MEKRMEQRRTRSRGLSRREFLKVGGAGLAGAALLGAAGCGGGEQSGGATELYFHAPTDTTGTTPKLIGQFNEKYKGKYKVIFQRGNSDTGQRLDKLRTQFQAGGEGIDIILGDVIWTAELAENGWIADLSDRFPESEQQAFLPGSVEAIIYNGKPYGMHAVVHGYGPSLLSQGLARKERLRWPAENLGRAQANDQEDACGVGHQVRVRLPGREVRGRGVRRLRVHLGPWWQRPGSRGPDKSRHRQPPGNSRPRDRTEYDHRRHRAEVCHGLQGVRNGRSLPERRRDLPARVALRLRPGRHLELPEARVRTGGCFGVAFGGRKTRQRHGRGPAALHKHQLEVS